MEHFEVKNKDFLARLGRFTTSHGTVDTPLLMPVVHPGKSQIKPKNLRNEFGFQMLITNSYIIKSRNEFRERALREGVHGLLDFDGPIMTDSGTFQMYFHGLPEGEIDPLDIVQFQREIGSDVGTILDVFSEPDAGRAQAEEDVKISLERAEKSIGEKGNMYLAGTIQGGVYEGLREEAASRMTSLDIDIHPIGGVVPLMERYRFAEVIRATLAAKKHLPPNRPVHLFGCGHPMFMAIAALAGCDFFDSASYAKFADAGRILLPTGTAHLENLRELPCDCPICSGMTADDLKQLPEKERVTSLMRHNLYVTASEMRRIRQSIVDGKLIELASARARSHPSLQEALQVIINSQAMLEENDPVGKGSSIFYTGPETIVHPAFVRHHLRTIRRYPFWATDTLLLVPHMGDRPFSDTTALIADAVRTTLPERAILFYVTPFGVVPLELEHVYPAQQTVFPKTIDAYTVETAKARLLEIVEKMRFRKAYWFLRDVYTSKFLSAVTPVTEIETLDSATAIAEVIPKGEEDREGLRKLRALFAFQWEIDISDDFLESIEIVYSRSTGKIRHLKRDGDILFTVVPTTGMLTPTFEGGLELLSQRVAEDYVVTMEEEASEFVAAGKSALAKFVTRVGPALRAGEETVVVDPAGNLVGVGKSVLNGQEMLAFDRGVAVMTRHSKKLD
jgi:7-cyano-7-deazaguanine tRNA-ribosyltransferase